MEPPHATELLQLVFSGEFLEGHDPQAVRDAVVAALKLDARRSARLFSGQRVVLRRAVDVTTAHRYIARFAMLGAVVRAEPMKPRPPPDAPAAAQAPATPRPAAVVARTPWTRLLRWTILGSAVSAGALLLGVLLGPGLAAWWPDAPPPDAGPAPWAAPREPQAPALASKITEATTAAAYADPTDAELPPDMTPDARSEYRERYLPARRHKAFAVSAARLHAWHAGAASEAAAREAALARCMGALRPGDEGCRIVDADGELLE